jgi:outer membrane protein OmpA-like peptidoglycan-associated protein
MYRILFILSSIILCINGTSQNLVPNHSFENIWSCPYSFVEYPVVRPYPEWYNPNKGTPDIFHACSEDYAGIPNNFAGNIYPCDGAAYAGIVLWEKYSTKNKDLKFVTREYIQTKLKIPLKKNKLYCVKLYYANASKCMYSIDALGVALTRQQISAKKGGLIIQMPQIINKPGHIMENTDYWEELCGTYRARGNETYLTIGNFWNNKQTIYNTSNSENIDSTLTYAYYFIDNISVFEIENAFECGCQNNLSYGSDWMSENFDPATGYNSIPEKNINIADIGNNNDDKNNENSSNIDENSQNSSSNLNNNSNSNNNLHDKKNTQHSTNDDNSLFIKESEISDEAFVNAKIGDKFNLNRIFFEFNSSELLSFSFVELDKLYDILSKQPSLNIEIRGHTDDIGSDQYNKTLSIKRAAAVYNYLLEKGIEKKRMKYRGFGNKVPISNNDTEEGRSLNRRVEIIIIG